MAITSNPDQNTTELLQLGSLIQNTINDFVNAKNDKKAQADASLPSHALFEARRILESAAGMLTELVSDPSSRIIEVALQHYEARALHIAAALRIPDILAEHGEQGCGIKELSSRVSIESRKLCMVSTC